MAWLFKLLDQWILFYIHIKYIVSKDDKTLWCLRRNLWRYTVAVKQQMYFALVRPLLEYASSVWDPHTTYIHKIEMVQRKAARFVIAHVKWNKHILNCCQILRVWTIAKSHVRSSIFTLIFKLVSHLWTTLFNGMTKILEVLYLNTLASLDCFTSWNWARLKWG